MIIKNLSVGTVLFLTIFVILEIEGNHLKSKRHENHRNYYKTNTKTTHGSQSKNFQRSKLNHTESGNRRQYLVGDNDRLTATDTFPQNGDQPSMLLQNDNTVPRQGVFNLRQSENTVERNLPFVSSNDLSQAMPMQTERPLPIPFKKPYIRLVPKINSVRYAKKPDVNVAHLHIHQGVNPCQHDGLVVQSAGGYTCLCRKEYKGKHCQEKDPCFPNPCQNGGNCIDHTTHIQCKCAKGFRGLRCQEPDSCDKNPCRNGATCLNLKLGLHCVCAVGYKGRYCTEMDFCDPSPCKNGGTCTEKNMAPTCRCTNDYKGTRCEARKVCEPNPCRNNGNCREDRSSSPCDCAQGFTGKYCSDHVCSPNPCLNGGACTFQKSFISSTWVAGCKCPPTFRGDKCEIPNPCAANPSPCKHGVCFDAFNAHHMDMMNDRFTCNCHRGYMGTKCDVRKCDKCDTNAKCQHEECVCNDGYYGNGHMCKKLPDPCLPNPCSNFGRCVPFESSYDCKCPFSFVGERCEQQL